VAVGPSNGAAVAGDVVGIAGEGSSPEQAAITHPRMNIVETKLNCLLWLTALSWQTIFYLGEHVLTFERKEGINDPTAVAELVV